MTEEQTVEGGLAEPEELEPDQGSLDLAAPEDRARPGGGVGGRGRRGAPQGPPARPTDDAGRRWSGTGSPGAPSTASASRRSARRSCSTGWSPAAGRRAPGEWDIRAHLAVTDAKADNETLLTDLEGGVTSLWLEADEDTDWSVLLDGVLLDLAPVVLQTTEAGARAFLQYADGRELHPRTNLGLDARARHPGPGRPGLADGACASSSSTRPRSTTGARRTCRSSPTRWPSGATTSAA